MTPEKQNQVSSIWSCLPIFNSQAASSPASPTKCPAFYPAHIDVLFDISSIQLTFSLFVASRGRKVMVWFQLNHDIWASRHGRVTESFRIYPRALIPELVFPHLCRCPSNRRRNPISKMGSIQWSGTAGSKSHSNEPSLRPSGERAELPRLGCPMVVDSLASLHRKAHSEREKKKGSVRWVFQRKN